MRVCALNMNEGSNEFTYEAFVQNSPRKAAVFSLRYALFEIRTHCIASSYVTLHVPDGRNSSNTFL